MGYEDRTSEIGAAISLIVITHTLYMQVLDGRLYYVFWETLY